MKYIADYIGYIAECYYITDCKNYITDCVDYSADYGLHYKLQIILHMDRITDP